LKIIVYNSTVFIFNEEGDVMSKLIFIMCLLLVSFANSGCTSAPPAKYGNTPEQQRKNAQDAQGELSTDVSRGAR
jgi:hypothetical protein